MESGKVEKPFYATLPDFVKFADEASPIPPPDLLSPPPDPPDPVPQAGTPDGNRAGGDRSGKRKKPEQHKVVE